MLVRLGGFVRSGSHARLLQYLGYESKQKLVTVKTPSANVYQHSI